MMTILMQPDSNYVEENLPTDLMSLMGLRYFFVFHKIENVVWCHQNCNRMELRIIHQLKINNHLISYIHTYIHTYIRSSVLL